MREIKKKGGSAFKLSREDLEDLRRFLIFLVLAIVVYSVATLVSSGMASYFVSHLLGLFFALLVFWAYSLSQKTTSKYSGTIVVLVFLLFFFDISHQYLVVNREKIGIEKRVEKRVERVKAIRFNEPALVKVKILDFGAHAFKMKKGEVSQWFTFPVGYRSQYSVSSDKGYDSYTLFLLMGRSTKRVLLSQ